eukprot:scaffold4805_cov136-Cylindrotheca_fusiformis.AAC.8
MLLYHPYGLVGIVIYLAIADGLSVTNPLFFRGSSSGFQRRSSKSFNARWTHRKVTQQDISSSSSDASTSDASASDASFDWESQWYPVAPISQLDEDAPQACTILNKKLVVWKSGNDQDGNALWSAFEDTCPHRKTSLSTGKITKDCHLTCRMHGWQFDKDGKNHHVPMMDRNRTAADDRALGVSTVYPTQTKGDMLWAFLNPSINPPPDLRDGSFIPDEEVDEHFWIHSFAMASISYESTMENSFDPSHAPFVHEKTGFRPALAIPMEHFQVTDDIKDAESGFTLEHSPYQKSSNKKKKEDTSLTIRQFIPPCTQVTDSSYGKVRLQFVPSAKRKTGVYFTFGIKKPKNPLLRGVLSLLWQSDFLHFMLELSEGRRQFNDQDRIIMQDQDDRKMLDGHPWNDMRPTTSDVGVATYQKWMTKYGGGGPFANLPPSPNEGAVSIWEFHGQYCARCKRILKGLVTLEKRSTKASRALLALGIVAAATRKKMQHILGSNYINAWPVLLIGSLLSRWCASWAAKMQDKMMLTHLSKRQNKNVYAYTR